jgi:general stress protein 26
MPVEISSTDSKATNFLLKNHVGVLATSDSSGIPHAATVYFVTDSDMNFLFITKENTEKSRNLQKNPQAAMAIFDAKSQTTLQVRGKVAADEDPQRFMNVFTQILKVSMDLSEGATPPISKLKAGEYRLYRLIPDSIRMAEYTKPEHGDLDDLFEVVSL